MLRVRDYDRCREGDLRTIDSARCEALFAPHTDACQNAAMNTDELASVKQKLRDFASANGMQWVLGEVDEAVALGVPEIRTLRQSSQQGRITYEDITEPDAGLISTRRRRNTEDFVTRRPMTESEQVELLVQALRRVLVDLDEIAKQPIKALNDPDLRDTLRPPTSTETENNRMPAPPEVSGISFAPDEGSSSPAISLDAIQHTNRSIRGIRDLNPN